MDEAATRHDKIPQKLSFKLAIQTIYAFQLTSLFGEYNEITYNKILITITYKKVGNRAGRTDPRVVKRRPKSFPRMQKPREQYKKKLGNVLS